MTENKRYFERMWGEEYYIFDSQTISEKEFDEKVEYEDYRAFSSSMTGDEVMKLLNENEQLKQKVGFYKYFQKDARELEKENNELKVELNKIKEDLDYYRTKCASLETGLLQTQRDVEWLRDNTVWEQMPTSKRTVTKTNFER